MTTTVSVATCPRQDSRTAADLATTAGQAALGTAILPGIGTVGVPLLVNDNGRPKQLAKARLA